MKLFMILAHLAASFTTDGAKLDASAKLPQFSQYGKSLVLAGGAVDDDNNDIFGKVVELAGGKGVAKLGIINTASADPADSYNYYHNLFVNTYGALQTNFIPVTLASIGNNSNPAVIQLISEQTGFFFGGGDQSRVTDSFLLAGNVPSPALQAIKDQWELGAVIAGTSAGTSCLPSAIMVTGGVSYYALRYGAKETSSNSNYLTYRKDGGLGIYDHYALDTHFGSRGREGRMMRLLWDTKDLGTGVKYGIGVDPNTALVVTHTGTAQETGEIVGELGVSFIDISKAFTDPGQTDFNIRNVYMTYLTAGDTIDMASRNVTVAALKTPLKGHEGYDHALTTSDIFYGESSSTRKAEFLRVAASIFDARDDLYSHGDTKEKNPRFRVTMSRTNVQAEGWVERHGTFHSDTHSYKDMYVEIHQHK